MNATSPIRATWCTALTWCLALPGFLTPGAIRAAVHGGIEIGAKGVKALVVEATGNGEDVRVKIKLSDTTNTALVAGIAGTGRFTQKALDDTVGAVKKYYNRFRGEFQITPQHIYVVGSSGLFAPIAAKPDLIKENQTRLAMAIKEQLNLPLTYIDVRREVELSIVGTLPNNRRKTGILIDVGGGNTKGGCQTGPGKFATFGFPFGTVTFSALARKNRARDARALSQLCDKTVVPLLKSKLSDLPSLANRDRVYLSGGVVWALATFTHPTASRTFTALTRKDVKAFEAGLAAHPGEYPEPDLSAVKDKELRRRALAEIARVKKVYRPEQLLAGTQIVKSVFQHLGSDRQFFFARHGYLGWILAYVNEAAVSAQK
jgi:exopolyphosphatase/pppGpp-phosphohydrolase